MAALSGSKELREHVAFNGLAEHMSTLEASFSLKNHWPVRVYLSAEAEEESGDSTVFLSTSLPHAWSEEDRTKLTKTLEKKLLPLGLTKCGGGYLCCETAWPQDSATLEDARYELVEKALKIVEVLEDVLGQDSHGDR